MDEDIYKKIIIIGIIGATIFLIVIFRNEIWNFLKSVIEWYIYDVGGRSKFEPISLWDWFLVIIIIVICIFYFIFKIIED